MEETQNIRYEDFWTSISEFNHQNQNVASDCFNIYDNAVLCWMNEEEEHKFKKILDDATHLTINCANLYENQLNDISSSYVFKVKMNHMMYKKLVNSKKCVEESNERLTLNARSMLHLWNKKIRYQKEIEIFDKIKYLMKAPEKALHLLNNDNIFEAVNIIQKAMEILNEEQMNEIESLSNIKKKLKSTTNEISRILFENIINELFDFEIPADMSLFDGKINDKIILKLSSSNKLKSYLLASKSLNEHLNFVKFFQNKLKYNYLMLILNTSNSIKVKKNTNETKFKDSFHQFIYTYQNNNRNNLLIKFFDLLLCKLLILLTRCKLIDNYFHDNESVIINLSFQEFITEISTLLSEFTTPYSQKNNSLSLSIAFKFISNEPTTSPIYSISRQHLKILPNQMNYLSIFPLFEKFKALSLSSLKINFDIRNTSINNNREYINEFIIKYTENIMNSPLNFGKTKPENFETQIYLNTTFTFETIFHFIMSTKTFPFLARYTVKSVIDLLQSFRIKYFNIFKFQINKAGKTFYAECLLNNNSFLQYINNKLVKKLVFDEDTDVTNHLINNFSRFEIQNEHELFSGKKILDDSDIINDINPFLSISTISESLIYLKRKTKEVVEENREFLNSLFIEKIENELFLYDKLIIHLICYIHIEIRMKCYQSIINSLMGNSFLYPGGDFATPLITKLQLLSNSLESVLSPSLHLFSFCNIQDLIFCLIKRYLTSIKEVNQDGSQILVQNINSFYSYKHTNEKKYFKVQFIASYLHLHASQLLPLIQEEKNKLKYSDVEPMFNLPHNIKDKESKKKLKEIFNISS